MSEVLYLHQTFTNCVSNQYTHFDILSIIPNLDIDVLDRSIANVLFLVLALLG